MIDITWYNLMKKIIEFRKTMNDCREMKKLDINTDLDIMQKHYEFCNDNDIDMRIFSYTMLYITSKEIYFNNNSKLLKHINRAKRNLKNSTFS